MIKLFLATILFSISSFCFAGFSQFSQKSIKYQTVFGACPAKSSTDLVVHIMSEFEKSHSLKSVKDKFVTEKWQEKYFLDHYRVTYNPPKKLVKIFLECPRPLARAVVYLSDGKEHYSATLVQGGKLLDPTYETLLKNEKILKADLPSLVLSVTTINSDKHTEVAEILTKFSKELTSQPSEVILSEDGLLTLILSSRKRPTNVFLGKDLWEDKIVRLDRIINHLDKQNKRPSQVNLTSLKKIVVKF